jgi:hypothetical protein
LCWAFYYSRETLCSRGKLNRQCHPCLTTLASRHSSTPPGPEVGSQRVVRRLSAGIANTGNAVVELPPRCPPSPSVLIALLDVRSAGLWVLCRTCLDARLFFLAKGRRQVIQCRLSVTRRRGELGNVYRLGNRAQSRVRWRFRRASQQNHQHRGHWQYLADLHELTLRALPKTPSLSNW